MYARITKDLIDCEAILGPEYRRRDKIIIGQALLNDSDGTLVEVRVLDDDRIPYYELVASNDDACFEAVLNWCMRDAGATILQLKKDGVWYDYMN